MISLNELKSILETTYEAVKYGEPSKTTYSMVETYNGVNHHHYLTYTSRFHNNMAPSYSYRSSDFYTVNNLASEIFVESYSDADNIGKSYIFLKNSGAYEFNLYPKSIDEIEFRVPGYKARLNEVLNDPALYFQISTLHDVPDIDFLNNFRVMAQELKSTMMDYKYKTKCSITKDMTPTNDIDKFYDKIKGTK